MASLVLVRRPENRLHQGVEPGRRKSTFPPRLVFSAGLDPDGDPEVNRRPVRRRMPAYLSIGRRNVPIVLVAPATSGAIAVSSCSNVSWAPGTCATDSAYTVKM